MSKIGQIGTGWSLKDADVNEQLCFNDWTVKVCEELARFGLTAERLVPWGFPWSLWWERGVAPVTAAWDAVNLSNNYRPDSQPMVDLRRGWQHARQTDSIGNVNGRI